jgi:hypothetical protein
MINAIPGLGWVLSLFFNASMAVPFWFVWTYYGVGAKYFYFLPAVYLTPGFWACVGVFIVMSILKLVFVPKLVTVNVTNKQEA